LCSLIISDSVAVEIFAIGQPCAKIFSKVWCATFFWDTVYITYRITFYFTSADFFV